MIILFALLQVAATEPQLGSDSVAKMLAPIRREVETIKRSSRRAEALATEQAHSAAALRSVLLNNEARELERRRRDSSLVSSQLAAITAQLAKQNQDADRLRFTGLVVGVVFLAGTGLGFWFLTRRLAVKHQQAPAIADVPAIPPVSELELRGMRADLQRLELLIKSGNASKPTDHSFPVTVAGELHRMQTRIKSMPSNTVGLSALQRSLERLRESLATLGYSSPELVGQPYVQGMVLEARFVPSDSMKPGESVITKVIRPQVNYRDSLIQAADVEVSTG